MKFFKSALLGLVLAFGAMTAQAEQTAIDTSGLTAAQVAQIKAQAAQMAASAATGKTDEVSDKLSMAASWGQQAATAAEGFARAIGIAARELNIEINKFADTPVGKMTIFFIAMKVFGFGVLNFIVATIGTYILVKTIRTFGERFTRKDEAVEITKQRLFGYLPDKKIRVYEQESWRKMQGGQCFVFALSWAAQALVLVVYLLNISKVF